MKSIFTKNVKIALTLIASLCLLYWGIEFLKGVNLFTPSNFYYADFDEVEGLAEAAPITVNGFQVGQVREIKFDYETNKISVMMSMNKSLKIPEGSSVALDKSLTGTASLELNLAKGGKNLEVGSHIDGVTPMGMLDKVGSEVMPQVQNIIPKVDSIMGSVNMLVSSPQLTAAVLRLDAITAELANSSRQLTILMNKVNASVPGILNNVDGITGNLTTTTSNLDQFSSSLNKMPIDSTMAELNATISNIKGLSEKLNSPNSSLGLLLNDTRLYNDADHAVASLDSLLTDIKNHPKRYVTIKVF